MKLAYVVILCIVILEPSRAQNGLTIVNKTASELSGSKRKGVLSNGFTYYLETQPGDEIVFRFVVNAGINEERDDQIEMSHFIEHLAFRESKHFPEGVRNYSKNKAIICGASTSFYNTLYRIDLTRSNADLISNSLQIVKHWAQDIEFNPSTIKSESGAIFVEVNKSDSPLYLRFQNEISSRLVPMPVMRSVYGNGIDRSQQLLKFDSTAFREFYDKWYRPDKQAIIVVGNFDMDEMEARIIRLFSELKKGKHTKNRRSVYKLPGKKRFEVLTDKDQKGIELQIFQHAATKNNKTISHVYDIAEIIFSLYHSMAAKRLALVKKEFGPLRMYSNLMLDPYSMYRPSNIDELSFSIAVDRLADFKPACIRLLTEMERLNRYGFFGDELVAAKESLLKNYTPPDLARVANKYITSFVFKSPIPEEIPFQTKLDQINIESINGLLKNLISSPDRIAFILANDTLRDKIPDYEGIMHWYDSVHAADIRPFQAPIEQNVILLPERDLPKASDRYRVVEGVSPLTHEVTLSNGIKVFLKVLDKDNQNGGDKLSIHGISQGGISCYSKKDIPAVVAAGLIESGFENLKADVLEQEKEKRGVYAATDINENFSKMEGSAKTDQLEFLLQLMYCYFKTPYKDQTALERWKQIAIRKLQNPLTPEILLDSLKEKSGLKRPELTISEINNVSLEKVNEVYKERFSNPADFTFFISGYFDVNALIPMLDKYLGSLPTSSRKSNCISIEEKESMIPQSEIRIGNRENCVKASAKLLFEGRYQYGLKNNASFKLLQGILTRVLFTRLREQERGIYELDMLHIDLNPVSGGKYSIEIGFSCNPAIVDRLINAVTDEIQKLSEKGPSQDVLSSVLRKQTEALQLDFKQSNYWINYFVSQYKYGLPFDNILSLPESLSNVTNEDIKETTKSVLMSSNLVKMIIYYP